MVTVRVVVVVMVVGSVVVWVRVSVVYGVQDVCLGSSISRPRLATVVVAAADALAVPIWLLPPLPPLPPPLPPAPSPVVMSGGVCSSAQSSPSSSTAPALLVTVIGTQVKPGPSSLGSRTAVVVRVTVLVIVVLVVRVRMRVSAGHGAQVLSEAQ
jgi:hypothetical protein